MRRSKVTIRTAKRKCPMSSYVVSDCRPGDLAEIGTPSFLALAPTAFASPVPRTACVVCLSFALDLQIDGTRLQYWSEQAPVRKFDSRVRQLSPIKDRRIVKWREIVNEICPGANYH